MPIIAPISGITLKIEDPEEFDPIELLELAIDKFSVKCHEFARIFGTEPQTISAWRCGRRTPTRQCRIRAYYLGKQWGLI
jgi:DNA-binding transcriptional regulator YiaG